MKSKTKTKTLIVLLLYCISIHYIFMLSKEIDTNLIVLGL